MVCFILALFCLLSVPGIAHAFVYVPPPQGEGTKSKGAVAALVIGLLIALLLGVILFLRARG